MQQLEELKTLWSIWEFNAAKFPDKDAIVFWRAGESPIRYTYKELLEKANRYSVALKKKGIATELLTEAILPCILTGKILVCCVMPQISG